MAVNALRLEPEAPALARAEASMIADCGMQDLERMFHEHEDIAKFMHISSLNDRPYRTEAQLHRVERERQKVRDAGHDPDWRPKGDATTLFKPGKEYGLKKCSDWAVESARATVRMALGMEPHPPPELRQEAEMVRKAVQGLGSAFGQPQPLMMIEAVRTPDYPKQKRAPRRQLASAKQHAPPNHHAPTSRKLRLRAAHSTLLPASESESMTST